MGLRTLNCARYTFAMTDHTPAHAIGRTIDVLNLAKTHGHVDQTAPVDQFARLHLHLGGLGGGSVVWGFRGETRTHPGASAAQLAEIWGHLSAQLSAPTQCQRCLAPMHLKLAVTRTYRFVATEAKAAELDDLLEDDVLVHARDFDLTELVEDELLMAMPVATVHDACPNTEVTRAAAKLAETDAPQLTDKPNPFAALAQLKKPAA